MFKRLIYNEPEQEHGKIRITDRKTNEGTVWWFKEKYLMIILLGAYILLSWTPLSYATAYAQNNPTKKVLILNSYRRTFEWTGGIVHGINSVLESEEQDIEIYIEDMDSKRFSSKAYIRELQHIYTLKFSGLKFDVVISSDDNAFHFLLRNHNDLFANTPVVFCGVNYFEDFMLKGHKLFTGVVEATDIKSNIKLILKLHPDTKSIAVITDNTPTGESTRNVLEQASKDYSGIVEITSLDGSKITRAELLEKLQHLPKGSQVLLMNFHRDKSDRFIPYTKFIPTVSANIKSPLYCASDNFLGYGPVGGLLDSAFHQGKAAGKMARLILEGEDVANIPVLKKSPNQYMFDYKQMQRFGIKLSDLPEGSMVINKPSSFYTDHKNVVWMGTVGISILTFIILVLFFNIHYHKRTEKGLRLAKERLSLALKASNSGIWDFNPHNFTDIHWEDSWFSMLGYTPDEIPNTAETWGKLIHPDDSERVQGMLWEHLEKKTPYDVQFRMKTKEGNYLWVRSIGKVVSWDKNGNPSRMLGIHVDVNNLKESREKLLKSEEKFKGFMETATDLMNMADKDANITYVNKAMCMTLGYSREEMIGMNISHILAKDLAEKDFMKFHKKLISEGQFTYEPTWVTRDGKEIHGEVKVVAVYDKDGEFTGSRAIFHDITERKLAEKEIKKLAVECNTILNTTPIMIFWIDKKGNFVRVNEAFAAALHKPIDDIIGRSLFELYPEVMAKGFFKDNAVVMESGAPQLSIQESVETGSGNIWVNTDKIAFRDDNGEAVGVIGFSHDITKQKHAEEELIKNKRMLQAVFDGISDPLIMVDKNMKVLLQNRAAMKYYGVSYATNCLNRECHQVFNGNPSPCEGCDIPSAVSTGLHERFERKGFMDPESLEQVVVYPLNHEDHGDGAAIIRISDVTRERQMEREIMQADKMISLGILVSGVAHEINNPNNFIMLNAPILREAWKSIVPVIERYYEENGDFSMGGIPYSEMRDEIPQLFSGIKEGTKRIKRIVQDLKNFARKDGADMSQSVNINQVIESSIRLTGNMIKKVTENFRVEYGRNLPLFKGNKQKLEQVMINLIQNACQALPDKGKGIFVTSSFDKEGGCVVVEVRDEGEGIPENVLARIMDPFFTTRRNEGGTGLGMSVSSNIVKGHGGKIEVESEWGRGTTFRFFIPTTRIEKPVKILVVDDDSVIRGYLTTALGKLGIYSVREASNGAEAFLKIGQEPPDLLILDVQMPDMDGVEVCRLIKEDSELSTIKVIIITGFVESSQVKEIAKLGFDKILAKPFRIQALLNMIDEVLEV